MSCRVTDHYIGGMRQHYQVRWCGQTSSGVTPPPVLRPVVQYFISADEVEWDYAPDRTWVLQKHNTNPDDR